MDKFPSLLSVNNKSEFSEIWQQIVLSYLRQEIYEHMLKEDENSYFALDTFNKKYNVKNDVLETLYTQIIGELEEIGWKCKLSYGNTGLFIYSTEKPPSNCWDGSF